MPTLFELKENMTTLQTSINEDAAWIAEKAADAAVSVEDLEKKKSHRNDLQKRYDMIKAEADVMEKAQKKKLQQDNPADVGADNTVKNKAMLYRAIAAKDPDGMKKAYQGLGAIPTGNADYGKGENLLPKTTSSELICEPAEVNTMRDVEAYSQVRGLEEPRVSFTIDDEDLDDVLDFETANEIQASGDLVSYGRHKTKVKVKISDTVVHGTDTNLVAEVENQLRGALARKEKLREFAKSADDDHKHMSYYMLGIKSVVGSNLVKAVIAAYSDLADEFQQKASVVMRKADYLSYIDTMANNSDTLWGKKPEDVIGIPVKFNDKATIPVVGDFNYGKWNYDPEVTLDADKDVDTGTYKYVLTAWHDHQIKLKSAFRLAVTAIQAIGGVVTGSAAGDNLKCTPIYNGETPTAGTTAYLWQVLSAGSWTDLTSAYTGYNTNELTTVDGTDENATFRCKVTYTPTSGDASTAYSNAVKLS